MNKFIVAAGFSALMIASCKKEIRQTPIESEKFAQPQRPVCGMNDAMRSVPSSLLEDVKRNASKENLQEQELLLLLKFDGARVVPGANGTAQGGLIISPIVRFTSNCPPSQLTAARREEVTQLVKDDFSPFKIVVTTSQEEYDAYPAARRQSCLITTTPQVLGFSSGTGGVSPFVGAGTRLTFTCFVFGAPFGNDVASIADVVSHEVGHALGLDHQHLYTESCGVITEYHPGFGTGPLSFAPIMGNGTKSVSNWFAQPCLLPLYNFAQDDFEAINSHVSLRSDDFPNDFGEKVGAPSGTTGVLEKAGDVDYLYITPHSPGALNISSVNIDLKATLYNAGGRVVGEYNDPESTGISIPRVQGVGYLKIEAAGNEHMYARFMTGEYKIDY